MLFFLKSKKEEQIKKQSQPQKGLVKRGGSKFTGYLGRKKISAPFSTRQKVFAPLFYSKKKSPIF